MQRVGHHTMTLICGPFLVVREAAACLRPRACPSAERAVPGMMSPRSAARAEPLRCEQCEHGRGCGLAARDPCAAPKHRADAERQGEARAVRRAASTDLGHRDRQGHHLEVGGRQIRSPAPDAGDEHIPIGAGRMDDPISMRVNSRPGQCNGVPSAAVPPFITTAALRAV